MNYRNSIGSQATSLILKPFSSLSEGNHVKLLYQYVPTVTSRKKIFPVHCSNRDPLDTGRMISSISAGKRSPSNHQTLHHFPMQFQSPDISACLLLPELLQGKTEKDHDNE